MKLNVIFIMLLAGLLTACSSAKPKPPALPMVEQTKATAIPQTKDYHARPCPACGLKGASGLSQDPYSTSYSSKSGLEFGGYQIGRGLQAAGQLKDYFNDKGTAESRCREMELLLNGNAEGTKVDDSGRLLVADGPNNYRVHPFVSWNFYYNNCVFNR